VLEITTAGVALVISILVALWNLLKYLLDGARVRVKLIPGLHDDYALQTGKTWARLGKKAAEGGGWNVEVAVIKVENLGRTAVTISGPGMVFGGQPWWRKPYRIVPIAREAPDALTVTRHRLEPFDSATFVYEVWQGVERMTRHPEALDRPLTVRAFTEVAGKWRPRQSSRRSRWRVDHGQFAFIPELAEIGMLTYRSMSRHAHGDTFGEIACIPTAIAVREQFPVDGPAPTREQLKHIIEENHFGEQKPIVGLIAYNVANDLHPLYKPA
jgi:hypothetical protein